MARILEAAARDALMGDLETHSVQERPPRLGVAQRGVARGHLGHAMAKLRPPAAERLPDRLTRRDAVADRLDAAASAARADSLRTDAGNADVLPLDQEDRHAS